MKKPSSNFVAALFIVAIFGLAAFNVYNDESEARNHQDLLYVQESETEAWRAQTYAAKEKLKEIRRFNEDLELALARKPKPAYRFDALGCVTGSQE